MRGATRECVICGDPIPDPRGGRIQCGDPECERARARSKRGKNAPERIDTDACMECGLTHTAEQRQALLARAFLRGADHQAIRDEWSHIWARWGEEYEPTSGARRYWRDVAAIAAQRRVA